MGLAKCHGIHREVPVQELTERGSKLRGVFKFELDAVAHAFDILDLMASCCHRSTGVKVLGFHRVPFSPSVMKKLRRKGCAGVARSRNCVFDFMLNSASPRLVLDVPLVGCYTMNKTARSVAITGGGSLFSNAVETLAPA